MTSMEDDPNGRQPQWKTTAMEEDLIGSLPQWRTTSMNDNLKGTQPQGITPLLKKLTSMEALQEAGDISLPS